MRRFSLLVQRMAQRMSSANAAVSAEPWSTVTFLNVMGSSGGTDDRSYVDIVNAYTANAAGRRAAHARDCSIKERSVDAQAFVPSCSPLSISHPDAAVVKLLSSAQSVAFQPSHFVTASWSTKVPVIGHLSSDTCVHIRITVSSNSNTDIFDSLACRLDQARVPSLVSSSSPEIDISYPAFNQVMRACASLISADVSAAERLHLVLTNKEKCGLLLSKLRHVIEDGGRGDVDDNDEGGQSRLGLLSPTFIHRKSIGMDNFKIMQAPPLLVDCRRSCCCSGAVVVFRTQESCRRYLWTAVAEEQAAKCLCGDGVGPSQRTPRRCCCCSLLVAAKIQVEPALARRDTKAGYGGSAAARGTFCCNHHLPRHAGVCPPAFVLEPTRSRRSF
jgi:hypothetical protein